MLISEEERTMKVIIDTLDWLTNCLSVRRLDFQHCLTSGLATRGQYPMMFLESLKHPTLI